MLASVVVTVDLGFATGGHTWSYMYVPQDRERGREDREREKLVLVHPEAKSANPKP